MTRFDIILKVIIRFVFFLMVYFYFYEQRNNFAYLPLTIYRIISWVGIGILCSFGLFFITTKLAKKWKIISIVLYLPTLLISPMLVPGNVILNYIISIILLIKYLPWRKK